MVEAPVVPRSMEKNAPPLAPKGPRMLWDKPTGPEIAYERAAKAHAVGAGASQPAVAQEAAVAVPPSVGESVEAPPTVISQAATPTPAPPMAALRLERSQLGRRHARNKVSRRWVFRGVNTQMPPTSLRQRCVAITTGRRRYAISRPKSPILELVITPS